MFLTHITVEAPFGGRRNSGVGQVNGTVGVRGYTYAQPIMTDRFGGKQTAQTYPYSFKKDAGMERLIRILYGSPLGRWLS